jgi:hypothetical protein
MRLTHWSTECQPIQPKKLMLKLCYNLVFGIHVIVYRKSFIPELALSGQYTYYFKLSPALLGYLILRSTSSPVL